MKNINMDKLDKALKRMDFYQLAKLTMKGEEDG